MTYTLFSDNQIRVFNWWLEDEYDAVIADGAIRSGKTLSMSVSFVLWSMHEFNGQTFALCGKTIESLRRNVVIPLVDGIRGLYTVKQNISSNYIEIMQGRVTNRYYLFGGKDERSYQLIQGITLAGILFDEVALMPRSFVEQGLARCSVAKSKFWFNCNPENPLHWFYLEWIQKREEKRALYIHFTMKDNLSLSDEVRQRYERLYSGVFYDRYILGKWIPAEGIIYREFAESIEENAGRYIITDLKSYLAETRQSIRAVSIGVDFGGNSSATVFIATVITDHFEVIIAMEKKISVQIDPDRLNKEYVMFVKSVIQTIGRGQTRADSAEQILIRGLYNTAQKNGLPPVKNALKMQITDRIRLVLLLMAQDRFKVVKHCVHAIKAFSSAVYDSKSIDDKRLDDGTSDIDTLDAAEYSIEPFYKDLMRGEYYNSQGIPGITGL